MKRIEAARRRTERDAKKRQRDLERWVKEQVKLSEAERARIEVNRYENTIEVLLTVHCECSPPIDWRALVSALPPHVPESAKKNEFLACLNQRLDWQYSSTHAESAIAVARAQDQREQLEAMEDHRREQAQWRRMRSLATDVIEGNLDAYQKAVSEFLALGELSALGSSIDLKFHGPKLAECGLRVKGRDVIPLEVKSLTSTGKLSVKPMSKARFHEIYQDYVCGCTLRLAREVFALLPIDQAIVTAEIDGIQQTRQNSPGLPVLSVAFSRERVAELAFADLDPSDTIETFLHRGDAKASRKSGEFVPVVPLAPTNLVPDEPRLRSYNDLTSIVGRLRSELKTAICEERLLAEPNSDSVEPLL